MAETAKYTCIGCPIGCPLRLEHEGNEIIEVSGYNCDRGAKYARQEFIEPKRGLSTTIAISGALWDRLPVKLTQPILKMKVMEAAKLIHELQTEAPVHLGQILMKDLFGEKDLHLVATRSMPVYKPKI